MTLLMEL